MLAMRRATGPTPEEQSFTEFAVQDHETEWVCEPSGPVDQSTTRQADGAVDRGKVSVSRGVLYSQGILLGLVAVGAFTFGVFVGNASSTPEYSAADPSRPCRITGRLFYSNNNRELPDEGAVVIVLPSGAQPGEKVQVEELRPDIPLPGQRHPGLTAIHELGGAYARADALGTFSLQVSQPGPYYVLFVSRHVTRRPGETIPMEHLAQMGRYFLLPSDLIGEQQYRWTSEQIRGDTKQEFVFARKG
jgi:hypothetical protein